jgi:hypothetical protein
MNETGNRLARGVEAHLLVNISGDGRWSISAALSDVMSRIFQGTCVEYAGRCQERLSSDRRGLDKAINVVSGCEYWKRRGIGNRIWK